MVSLEKAGIPTATILSEGFQDDALASAKAFGMGDIKFAVVPKVYNNITVEETLAQTDPAMDEIIKILTTTVNGHAHEEAVLDTKDDKTSETFEGEDQFGAADAFNAAFMDRDWGDGFPLIPPTQERVEKMLAGTSMDPDELVCLLPPGTGYATVRKIAINAVMAGCKPEHLPVLMAGARALASIDPQDARGWLMSTSAHAPLWMVNGPIAKELGINSGRATLGPGKRSQVNITIGRGFLLMLKNVGHWYTGHLDMDTIGTTRKFPTLIAENEEDSPWEPFHVEQGFRRDASTVTVFGTRAEMDVGDQGNSTGPGILRTIAYAGNMGGGEHIANLHGEYDDRPRGGKLMLIAPAHANPIFNDGFTKKAAKSFIHAHSKRPARELINNFQVLEKVKWGWKWLYDLSPFEQEQTMLHTHETPDRYWLVCVGANDRAKDLIFAASTPGTAEIEHRASVNGTT